MDDTFTTNEDKSAEVDVQANDFDIDEDILTTSILGVSNGQAIVFSADLVVYVPAPNFAGVDTVTYQVCDNGTPILCDTAIITITVEPLNDDPVLTEIDSTPLPEDSIIVVCTPFSDIDMGDTFIPSICDDADNGTTSVSIENGELCLTYEPNGDYYGLDSVCVMVCDQAGACDSTTVTFEVTPINDSPIAVDDNESIVNTPDIVVDVQANDSDIDGDILTTTIVNTGTILGSVEVLNGDSISYSAPLNFEGTDTIAYQVCDSSSPVLCDTAIVIIQIDLDICQILANDPNHPIGEEDYDGGGVNNATECADGNDPKDTSDDISILEGFVWVDTNSDGIQNPEEAGEENVTVYLIDRTDGFISGNPNRQVNGDTLATTLTDITGRYSFQDIASGLYQIAFDASTSFYGEDFNYTIESQGPATEDNDANSFGLSEIFEHDAGNASETSISAGLLLQPRIGNVMWVTDTKENEEGYIEISFSVGVRNTGRVPLANIALVNDLTHLGSGFMGLKEEPILINSNLANPPQINTNYDGVNDLDIFDTASNSRFEVEEEILVSLIAIVSPQEIDFPLMVQTSVSAIGRDRNNNPFTTINGITRVASDLSDSGQFYTGTNPGEPGDTGSGDDSTLIECFDAKLEVVGNDNVLCIGDQATVEVISSFNNINYEWKIMGEDNVISTTSENTFSPTESTTYIVTVESNNNICLFETRDTIEVIVSDELITNITNNSFDCNEIGSSIELNSNLSGGTAPFVYQWNGPSGFTSTQANPTIVLDSEEVNGLYILEVLDANGCTTRAEVELNLEYAPGTPEAFTEEAVCTASDIILAVNNPDPEQLYRWFRASDNSEIGLGAVLNIANASVNEAGGYYVIANSNNCVSNQSNIVNVLVDEPSMDIAFAGNDEIVCEDNFVLNATPVTDGEGRWVNINTTSTLLSPNQAQTTVTNLQIGENQFAWHVSNGLCIDSSIDTITITYELAPTAQDDVYATEINQTLVNNVIDNDSPNTEEYTISSFVEPQNGELELDNNGVFRYQPSPNFVGTDSYQYELCHLYCPDKCVEATVFITIGEDAECFAPTIMTPNEDGVNDTFVIPCLNNFTNSHMCIYNRWGDEVFRSENYQNDWDGTNQNKGESLPSGTYFYQLQVNDGNDTVLTGYIFVQR